MRGLQIAACLVSPLPGVGEQATCWPHRIGNPLKLIKTYSLLDFGNRGCVAHREVATGPSGSGVAVPGFKKGGTAESGPLGVDVSRH